MIRTSMATRRLSIPRVIHLSIVTYERTLTLTCLTANITGLGDWAKALTRAQALVAQMTLEEMVRTHACPLNRILTFSRTVLNRT